MRRLERGTLRFLLLLGKAQDLRQANLVQAIVVERPAAHEIAAAAHFVERARTEGREAPPNVLCDEAEKCDRFFFRPGELLAQVRVLGRNADGTGVLVT